MKTEYWVMILALSVGSCGLIQYLKGWLAKAPSWVWAIVSPVVCIGGAILVIPWPWCVIVGILSLTVAQLGYETLIQGIIAAIDSATGANITPPKS